MNSKILFIDPQVEDYQSLISGVNPGVTVVILDANQDGIQQITQYLTRHPLSEIHIVSHGAPGCLSLGNRQLNLDTLAQYTPQLNSWSADSILLYGCNVAAGDAGAEFVEKLHQITGAEIAASTTKIGHISQGGNWELDVKTREIEPVLAFNSRVKTRWNHTLEDDEETTTEDIAVTVDVLGNDTAIPDGSEVLIDTNPSNGTAIVNGDGTITYTPNANFSGQDSLIYTVNGNPLPTTANDDRAIVTVDTPATIDVLFNDFDPQNDPLTVTVNGATSFTTDEGGTVTVNADNTLSYTPAAGYLGADSFSYEIDDGNGNTDTAIVELDVQQANPRSTHYLPTRADTNTSHSRHPTKLLITTENVTGATGEIQFPGSTKASIPFNITSNESDFSFLLDNNNGETENFNTPENKGIKVVTDNGEPINVQLVQENSNGQSFLTSKGLDALGTEFRAGELYNEGEGDGGDSVQSFISVIATEDNTEVTFTVPPGQAWNWDGFTQQTVTVTLNEGETYVIRPGNKGEESATGALITSNQPIAVANGAMGVRTGGGAKDNGWDQLVPVNRVGSEYVVVKGNSPFEFVDIVATEDNTEVLIDGVSQTTLQAGESFQYDFSGKSLGDPSYIETSAGAYAYQTSGAQGGKGENGVSLIPAINPSGRTRVRFRTPFDPGTISVITGASAADSMELVNVTSGTPTTVDITAQSNYAIKDVPGRDDIKVVTFDFTDTSEEFYLDAEGFIQVGILAANNAGGGYGYVSGFGFGSIQATDDLITSDVDGSVSFNVLDNDYDADGDTLTVTIVGDPENGTVTDDGSGNFTYEPNVGFSGTDSFTYSVTDGNFHAAQATVSITVTDVPSSTVTIDVIPDADTPSATASDATGDIDATIPLTLSGTPSEDTDGSETLSYKITGVPTGASFTDGTSPVGTDLGSGEWSFTAAELASLNIVPPTGFSGEIDLNLVSVSTDTADSNGNGITDANEADTADSPLVPFTVTVAGLAPDAVNDTANTPEDTAVTIDVSENDTDTKDGTPTGVISIMDEPTNGTVTIDDNGTPDDTSDDQVEYTPNKDFDGTDTFTYTIKDSDGLVSAEPATVTVNVGGVNDKPVANDDNETTPEDTAVTINVKGNDTDAEDTIPTGEISINTTLTNGTVEIDDNDTPGDFSDDQVVYTPSPNFTGTDSFTYTVKDNDKVVSEQPATVTVTVEEVNDEPVATDDNETTPEDTAVTINVRGNDTDVEDTIPTGMIEIVSPPENGTVTIDDKGTPDTSDDEVVYTPNPDFDETDTFTYTVEDKDGVKSNPATVNVTVDPVNDIPVANDDGVVTDEDTPVTVNIRGNDTDIEDGIPTGEITISIIDQPTNGTVDIDDKGTSETRDDEVVYTPNPDFAGTDTFTYTVTDSQGTPSNEAEVIISVGGVNDQPIATDDTFITPEDTPVTVNIRDNDTDTEDGVPTGEITIIDEPENGSVEIDDNGTPDNFSDDTVVYTPDENYGGPDSFTYTITDSEGLPSNTATVNVNTDPSINDIPVANEDNEVTPEDNPLTIDVSENDFDVEDGVPTGQIAITSQPENGTATIDDKGTPDTSDDEVVYTPNPEFNGTDTFTYTITDSEGAPSEPTTVSVDVESINDTPIAENDEVITPENTPVTINVAENDTDIEDGIPTGVISIIDQPTNGTVVIDDKGTPETSDDEVLYTPNPDFDGTDTFTYTIEDSEGQPSSVATVTLTVDDPGIPVAVDDGTTTPAETPVTINILENDTDNVEIVPETVAIVDNPGNGTLTINPDGTVEYTPNPGFVGEETFTYTVTDNEGNVSEPATVSVIVQDPDQDTDGDGIPDINDLDDDNDGILDTEDGPGDTDGDGVPDIIDLDSDNDGIADIVESGLTPEQIAELDSDGDGVIDPTNEFGNNGVVDSVETTPDSGELDLDGDGVADEPVDTDNDGTPDFQDLDSDNDGLNDIVEAGNPDVDGNGT
ncbi:MAG: Ig-like domain-containing protein, partial [Microcoleaceae cyanobacterium]